MDALEEIKQYAANVKGFVWSGQAQSVFKKYPDAAACYSCKHGIARVTVGTDSGGKHDIHLIQYCRLLSNDVYDNADDYELVDVVQSCDGYDDSPDED